MLYCKASLIFMYYIVYWIISKQHYTLDKFQGQKIGQRCTKLYHDIQRFLCENKAVYIVRPHCTVSWIRARTTDTQRELFSENPKLLGLGRQIGPKNLGAFGVFLANLSAPILVLWVPCPCFPLINHFKHYFYKKLSLYIQIPNIYLGLVFEFEFGP